MKVCAVNNFRTFGTAFRQVEEMVKKSSIVQRVVLYRVTDITGGMSKCRETFPLLPYSWKNLEGAYCKLSG